MMSAFLDMGRKGIRETRKIRSSGSDSDRQTKKHYSRRGPSEGDTTISGILGRANSVLYGEEADDVAVGRVEEAADDSVFTLDAVSVSTLMASGSAVADRTGDSSGPSLSDVMACLRGIECRLNGMDKKLDALEEVKEKVGRFESEVKRLWVSLEDRTKKVSDRVVLVEERVESTNYALGMLNDKVVSLEKERILLREEVTYLQSQSMRCNLLFSGINEAAEGAEEDTETTVRQFMMEKMKIAREAVDRMVLDHVHRLGPRQQGRCKKIVAKFLQLKDREYVRKQWKTLKGNPYYVSEQFPKEVVEARKRLVPKMKAARQEGKRAWIAYT